MLSPGPSSPSSSPCCCRSRPGSGAQTPDTLPSPGALKRLSLEQLMDIEVTSVSRRPEKLSATASAIQIITGDDIRRSGAASLAEALRLAPNLQVAQANSSQWAVSARGFNNVLANKLLVLIDGRTVYTPLYAGVFWDVQNVAAGDGRPDRGHQRSGRRAVGRQRGQRRDQHHHQERGGDAGPRARGRRRHRAARASATLRYGGRLGAGTCVPGVRHGLRPGRHGSPRTGPMPATPGDWVRAGSGWTGAAARRTRFTLQGDYYEGRPDPDGNADIIARGGNALGRWTRTLVRAASTSSCSSTTTGPTGTSATGSPRICPPTTWTGSTASSSATGRRSSGAWATG